MRLEVFPLLEAPVRLWAVRLPVGGELFRPPFDEHELLAAMDRSLLLCAFRAVNLDRLPVVLRTGIDVEPPTAVIYANDFEKAWEYGDWPKLVLALDFKKLDRTWREVPASTSPDELASLQRTFPTTMSSKDGRTLWLSRLDENDTQIGTDYEVAHAYWIPGDEAVRAAIIFLRPEDKQPADMRAEPVAGQ